MRERERERYRQTDSHIIIPDSEVIGLVIFHFVFEHLVDILVVLFKLSPRLSKFRILVHHDFCSVFVGVKCLLLDITKSRLFLDYTKFTALGTEIVTSFTLGRVSTRFLKYRYDFNSQYFSSTIRGTKIAQLNTFSYCVYNGG